MTAKNLETFFFRKATHGIDGRTRIEFGFYHEGMSAIASLVVEYFEIRPEESIFLTDWRGAFPKESVIREIKRG